MQPPNTLSCVTTASQPSRATCVGCGGRLRAPRSPQLPRPAKIGLAAGFFGNCTAFWPVQGPKSSYGQGVASQPSRATCVGWRGCPRAARSPKPPGPAQNWPRAPSCGRARAVLVGHAANLPPTVLRPCCLARAVVWCPCPPNGRLKAPKRPGRPKTACGHAFGAVHRLFLVGHASSPPLAVLRPRCLARAAGWCPPHHNRAGAAPNRLGLPQLACGHPFGAMHGPFCPPPPATWAHDGVHVAPPNTPIC